MTEKNERNAIEHGKLGPNWLIHLLERRYAALVPRKVLEELPHHKGPEEARPKPGQELGASLFLPGPGNAFLAKLPPTHWLDARRAWAERLLRERRFHARRVPRFSEDLPAPGVPGSNNWVPIGPAVVRKGQATGNPPISGRAVGLAIAPGATRAYVATADGGVWRTDDAGASWRSTMDGFDADPLAFAATSSACGAIAIDPADPDRVYVGTGEGETNALFASRLQSALPAYRGIGPIRSDNGGGTWEVEPTAPGSPTLVGSAFFELAVDPGDRENVVAATNVGLYRREPDGAGGYHWVQKRTGIHSSVVACRTGSVTSFFAAAWGVGVFSSADGNAWAAAGTGLPGTVQRITLAARPTDPSVLYAFAGGINLFRLDGGTGSWRTVGTLPALGGSSSYCLSLAVDPNNANTLFMAGTAFGNDGSVYRCGVTSSGSGTSLTYAMTSTFVGSGVHADVHRLVYAPADSNALWVACDGGVFRTLNATAAASFAHRNTGLATLSANFFTQHPTQPAVLLVGLQDNGTARYTGEEAWLHVLNGDGGYCIINWNDPNQVLGYVNGSVRRATDGGQGTGSFSVVLTPAWVIMAEPLAGTPYRPGSPSDANTVAFGAGTQLFVSDDFGQTWGGAIATLSQNIFALAFASPTRLYVGTVLGQVFRFDKSGATWSSTRIDNAAGGALGLAGLVTDIAVDPADATGASVYLTLGGNGDQRHVWHFDGTQWQSRSGTGLTGLLDVEHNAIVADPLASGTLYVGTDIGVWTSTDSGGTWATLQNGLPDAAVFDVQIHPTSRLLRAATHGRGLFEYKLDAPAQADTELYVRDTALDVGRSSSVDGIGDPETWPSQPVFHYLSRNIKVDVPTPAGYQTPTSAIDFLSFNDVIVDGSQHTATMDPAAGTVVNRVYVEVHNRGVVEAASVKVMAIVTTPSVALAPLPAGYESNVIAGTPIATANWQTVGIKTLTNLRAGFPQVAAFSLPSTMLPPPASLPGSQHHCMLAFVHSSQDAFTSTQTGPDALTIADRKVGQRNLQVVAFSGTPPPDGTWAQIDLHGLQEREGKELIFDLRGFHGRLGVLLPPGLGVGKLVRLRESQSALVPKWAKQHVEHLRGFIEKGRFHPAACRRMISDIRNLSGAELLMTDKHERTAMLSGLQLEAGKRYPLFLYFEPPEDLKPGKPQQIHVVQRDMKTKRIEGGCTYDVVLVPGKR